MWARLYLSEYWPAGITSAFRAEGMSREVGKSKFKGSIQSYQNWNRKFWSKHEPVKIGEGCCKKSTAPCTGPSTWSTVRLELVKVNINFIANRLRDILQATVISVPIDTRPTFITEAIGGEVGRWELKESISVLLMMNYRGLGLIQTCGDR